MKVGILTFTYGDNFGQRLQNYALQCRLASMGCDVFTLRQTGRKKNKSYELKQFIKGCMGKSDYIMKMKRHRKFADFDRQYISYYPERIGEGCIPEGLNEEFDYFVCGSDQIWSPFSDDVNDTLFLTFAPREKRISYAASIAADSIPEENQDKYKNRLCGFERISLREDRLSDWIERNTGVKPEELDIFFANDFIITSHLISAEIAGYLPWGEGWKYICEGRTAYDGDKPINTNGGRTSFGHAHAASGLADVYECCMQMRGECGERQVKKLPKTAMLRGYGGAQNIAAVLLRTID